MGVDSHMRALSEGAYLAGSECLPVPHSSTLVRTCGRLVSQSFQKEQPLPTCSVPCTVSCPEGISCELVRWDEAKAVASTGSSCMDTCSHNLPYLRYREM